jgi:hypothetical protein
MTGIVENIMKIIIAPIGKKAISTYIIEMGKVRKGMNAKWDDRKEGKAEVGDLFAFLHQMEDNMELYKVIGFDERESHWEESDRQCIVLKNLGITMQFSKYKLQVGYKENYKLQGTSYGRWVDPFN